ncbi:MAG: YdcF family protein [Pseudomonadota bacterium]
MIASGGVGKSGYNEAAIMTKYLQANGVNQQDIITDLTGINTMATAINTAKIASEHNFKTIVIVSQYYHLPRCELAFRRAGITNFSADYPLYFELYDIYSIIREAVAIPFYMIYGVER